MRNIIVLSLCLAIVVGLISSGVSDGLIDVIVEDDSTGAIVNAYAGSKIAESREDDLSEPSGDDWENRSIYLLQKWNRNQNQTLERIQILKERISAEYLYYARYAESLSIRYVDRDFDSIVARNVCYPMMLDYAQMITSLGAETEIMYKEMLAKSVAWNDDPSDPRELKFKKSASETSMPNEVDRLYTGYHVDDTVGAKRIFAKNILLIPNISTGFVRCHFINYSSIPQKEFTVEFYTETELELNGDYLINMSAWGDGIVRGIDFSFGGAFGFTTHWFDNRVHKSSMELATTYLTLWNASVELYGTYNPYNERTPIIQLINEMEDQYDLIASVGGLKHTEYRVGRGYDSFSEIPDNELVHVPDVLFWKSELLEDISVNESLVMGYAYLDWLNRTDLDFNDSEPIKGYETPFTNMELISNITLQRTNATYNSGGSLIGWNINETIISGHDVVIIPLENNISLEVGENANLTQDFLIIDLETYSFYNKDYFDGDRINRYVYDYRVVVHGIEIDGSSELNGTVEKIDLAEYVEDNYDLGIPEPGDDGLGIIIPVSGMSNRMLFAGVAVAIFFIFMWLFYY